MLLSQQNVWTPLEGSVIRVGCALHDHVAFLGDGVVDGERSVLSFSAQTAGPAELSMSAFAASRTVTVDGYLGGSTPEAVMPRARAKREQSYSWTEFNCEHFVRYAHGVPLESPQLQQWTFMGGLLGVLAFISARA